MDKKTKKAFTGLFLVLAIITSASAVNYEFYRSTVDSNAVNSNIYFEGLNQSTDYKLVRDDGTTVKTFTSTSTSVKNITFDFTPLVDGYTDLSNSGFTYRLKQGSTTVEKVNLYPSYFVRHINEFNDGVFSSKNLIMSGSTSESNNKVRTSNSDSYSSQVTARPVESINETQTVIARVRFGQGTSKYGGGNYEAYIDTRAGNIQVGTFSACSSGGGWGCGTWTEYKDVKISYNDINNQIIINYDGETLYINNTDELEGLRPQFRVVYDDADYTSAKLGFDRYAIVPRAYKNLWNTSEALRFNPNNGMLNAKSFKGHLNYTDTTVEMRPLSSSSWTSQLSSFLSTDGLDVRTSSNGVVDYLAMNTSIVKPPEISSTTFDPSEWKYRDNIQFTTNINDPDGIVEASTYDVYVGGVKVVDNRSLSATSNPDVYATDEGFNIDEPEVTYRVKIKAWDNEGYKTTKTFEQSIPAFPTTYKFNDVGTWKDHVLTPQYNATGLSIDWTGYNSTETNITWGQVYVFLESQDRELDPNGYDVTLPSSSIFMLDSTNGSFQYNIDFSILADLDETQKILGDDITVVRELRLYSNNSGILEYEKKIAVESTHSSMEEQGGFFQAVYNAINSALSAVGDFLGISDVINDVIDTLQNVIGDLADTLETPLNAIESVINDVYTAIAEQVNAVLETIEDVIREGLYILMDAVAGLLNGISQTIGYIANWFDLQIWKVQNVGLIVHAQYDGSNKTLTYYDYTGNYSNPMSEANVSVQKAILQQYSMNSVYSSVDYLNDNNIGAGTLNKSKMFTLYNAVNTSNNTRDVEVYSYFRGAELPTGVSTTTVTVHKAIATIGAFIDAIMSAIPDAIIETGQDFFNTASNVSTLLGVYLGGLVGAVSWMATEGLQLTTVLIQMYVVFTGLKYAELILDALDENITLTTAVNQILEDLEAKYMRVLNLFEMTYSSLQTTGLILIQILRAVKSSIPFVG